MPRLHHERDLTTAGNESSPSAMAQASAARPFTAYTYRGWDRPEPPEVTAARERHRAMEAALEAERSGANAHRARRRPGPPRRPRAGEDEPAPVSVAQVKQRNLIPVSAELAPGLFPGADFTGVPAAAAAPPPAERCRSCRYLTTAPGHAIQCGGTP